MTKHMFKLRIAALCVFLCCIGAIPTPAGAGERTVRVGYFPNITHAHALVAQSFAAEGNGWFERKIPGVTFVWQSFNAGPSAMESLFARSVDMTYVGPSPVLNAFVRSRGGISVVSGAVRGGAGLVVPKDSQLREPLDFRGKRIATPQLGNTQDVACRYWLSRAGLRVTLTGGDALVVPTANSGILPLFVAGDIDAAWTVEPWISRLELECDGRLVYAEPMAESITTVLAVGETFREKDDGLIAKFVAAHKALTDWIIDHPEEAKKRVADELTRQMRRPFPPELVERAWPRLVFDNTITADEFRTSLEAAQVVGFLRGKHDLSGLVSAHE